MNTTATSITCPVCENLCSSQAISCPKCGHPFKQESEATPQSSSLQPFIIIFRIITYVAIVIGGWHLLILVVKPFTYHYESSQGEPVKNIIYLIISVLTYAIVSFLISIANKK